MPPLSWPCVLCRLKRSWLRCRMAASAAPSGVTLCHTSRSWQHPRSLTTASSRALGSASRCRWVGVGSAHHASCALCMMIRGLVCVLVARLWGMLESKTVLRWSGPRPVWILVWILVWAGHSPPKLWATASYSCMGEWHVENPTWLWTISAAATSSLLTVTIPEAFSFSSHLSWIPITAPQLPLQAPSMLQLKSLVPSHRLGVPG